jgi:DNA polymerase-1
MWLAMDECRKYATGDAERTWLLWAAFEPAIVHGGNWKAYQLRKELLPIFYEATSEGLNFNVQRALAHIDSLKRRILKLRRYITKQIGAVVLFKWEKKDHMISLLHGHLKLPQRYKTEKGFASTNKEALKLYAEMTADPTMKAVMKGVKLATELRYVQGYFDWLADDGRIHANTNITGTRETRQSSSNPNFQNITASLWELFEPPEGTVWWYADFVNIELRLWAFATNNEELIAAFASGKSVHMLIMETLYPEEAARFKKNKDDLTLAKLYRDVKAGNFALIYGATDEKADQTYRQSGATQKIYRRFPGIKEYTQGKMKEAQSNLDDIRRHSVTTLLGYPLDVPLDEPFKACNYNIQGSAGMIMSAAMVKIKKNPLYTQSNSKIVQQVHDSIRVQIPINKYIHKVCKMLEDTMSNCVIEEFGPTPIDYKIEYNPRDKTLLEDIGLITEAPF